MSSTTPSTRSKRASSAKARPKTKSKPKRTDSDRTGIGRIEQPDRRTFGWYVRVNFLGKTLAKFFPDRKSGGKAPALVAAKAHRNKIQDAIAGKLGDPWNKRYITRMDYARVCGWWVRVPDGKGGRVSQLFSDEMLGGTDEALAKAKRWRDVQAAHLGLEFVPAPATTARASKTQNASVAAE